MNLSALKLEKLTEEQHEIYLRVPDDRYAHIHDIEVALKHANPTLRGMKLANLLHYLRVQGFIDGRERKSDPDRGWSFRRAPLAVKKRTGPTLVEIVGGGDIEPYKAPSPKTIEAPPLVPFPGEVEEGLNQTIETALALATGLEHIKALLAGEDSMRQRVATLEAENAKLRVELEKLAQFKSAMKQMIAD